MTDFIIGCKHSMTVAVVEMIFRQIDKAFKKEHTGGLF